MLSSTSSSRQRLPRLEWQTLLCGVIFILIAYVALSETLLGLKGFDKTVMDGQSLWIEQRERAGRLGKKSLLIIGASRSQLGIDLPTLRRESGLEPVQLAIDGSSFMPVLEGLAKDPEINGTVVVDLSFAVIGDAARVDAANEYQVAFERSLSRRQYDLAYFENKLWRLAGSVLRNYADGMRPLDALRSRILDPNPTKQYLQTYADRSRKADYRLVPMPDFYYARVVRELGDAIGFDRPLSAEQMQHMLAERVSKIAPEPNGTFVQGLEILERRVKAIQGRGGKVVFLLMPSSGFVKQIERKRYPREHFWNRLVASTSAQTFHVDDAPELAAFNCPDGSHLDYRDTEKFTSALVESLGLAERRR